MLTTIKPTCPHCNSNSVKKNGKKYNRKQNFYCKNCHKQFLAPSEYNSFSKQEIAKYIASALVRGCGIRDVMAIFRVGSDFVYKIIKNLKYTHKPQKKWYECLEIDEFWTYVGKKENKKWLIYAYDRETGEIVAYVWGKRDSKTAKKLRDKLKAFGVEYGLILTDNWDSFEKVFNGDLHIKGKYWTKGIEGNNCRLRHRNRRFFRKTCCFSKKLSYHLILFRATLYYINFREFLFPAYLL